MGIPNFQTDPYFGLSHLATFGSLLKISPARYTLFHKHHKPSLEKSGWTLPRSHGTPF